MTRILILSLMVSILFNLYQADKIRGLEFDLDKVVYDPETGTYYIDWFLKQSLPTHSGPSLALWLQSQGVFYFFFELRVRGCNFNLVQIRAMSR